MRPQPFHVDHRARVLELRLSTPGSEVNVFDRDAALQLRAVLAEVTPRDLDALVLCTGKPGSFVNGVGLLMANAVSSPEDVTRLTAPIRAAYRALETCEVPTIAVVDGSCFGCGVELALRCDARIAVDRWDTQFRMTELADYLFVPCFGGTQLLPPLVGFDASVDLLLWGETWSATAAVARGLADAAPAPDEVESALSTMVRTMHSRPRRRLSERPSAGAPNDATWARIRALPPEIQPPYRDCATLLAAAAHRGRSASGFGHELLASGRSLVRRESKAAQSYFFVRTNAILRARGVIDRAKKSEVVLHGLDDLAAALMSRRLRDLDVTTGTPSSDSRAPVVLAAPGTPVDGVDATFVFEGEAPRAWGAPLLAYAPWIADRRDVVELLARDAMPERARRVADVLHRAGLLVVATGSRSQPLATAMRDAFYRPIRAHLSAGGSEADVAATLRESGYVDPPTTRGGWFTEPLGAPIEAHPFDGRAIPALASSILLSVFETVLAALPVIHPSAADVLARELLAFPLSRGSLCRYATRRIIAAALEEATPLAHSALLDRYAGGDRDVYA